jgi:HEAT repeat protein
MKRAVLAIAIVWGIFLMGGQLFAQESVEQYLLNLKEPSQEDYVKLLYEGSRENKLLAIDKLREMHADGQEVVDALIFGLQQGTVFVERDYNKVINDFWDVRAESAIALGEIGDPRALDELHTALRYDPDNLVRSSVAIGIGKMGEPRSIPHLARAIDLSSPAGPDDQVVRSCVIALGEIGDRDAFVPLVEVMRGGWRRSIKLEAREALKKLRW